MSSPILAYASPTSDRRDRRRAAIVLFVWAGVSVPVGAATIAIALFSLIMFLVSTDAPVGLDLAATIPFVAAGAALAVLGIAAWISGRRLWRDQRVSLWKFILIIFVGEYILIPFAILMLPLTVAAAWYMDPSLNSVYSTALVEAFSALLCGALLTSHVFLDRAQRSLTDAPTSLPPLTAPPP